MYKNLSKMTPADMALLSTEELAQMQDALAALKEEHDTHKSLLDQAINARFKIDIEKAYAAKGGYTGSAKVEDGEYVLEVNVPKKVNWDQSMLKDMEAEVRSWGEDPEQYIKFKREVPESAFKAWPDTLKSKFAAARTEGAGKPTFKIVKK